MYPVIGAAILIGGAAVVTAGLGYIAYKAVSALFRGVSKIFGFNSPHETGKYDPQTQPLRPEESATFYAVKNQNETMRKHAEEVKANTARTQAHTQKIREDRQRQRQQFDALKSETRELNSSLNKTLNTTIEMRKALEASNKKIEESLGTTETESWKDMQEDLARLRKELPKMQAETKRQLEECDRDLAEGEKRLAEGARQAKEDDKRMLSLKSDHRRALLGLFNQGDNPEDLRTKGYLVFTSDEEFFGGLFEKDKHNDAVMQYEFPKPDQSLFEPQFLERRMSI